MSLFGLLIFGLQFILPFEASPIVHLKVPKITEGDVRQPELTIETPSYLSSTKSVRLKWVLHASGGSCIQFVLERLTIDSPISDGEACFNWYLAIFDGRCARSPILLRACHPLPMPYVVRSTGNLMHIAFYGEIPKQGFLGHAIEIRCSPAKTLLQFAQSPNHLSPVNWSNVKATVLEIPETGHRGRSDGAVSPLPLPPQVLVATPSFPASAKDVRLRWIIGVPKGSCVQFVLKKFAIDYQTACYSGFLAAYDGPNDNSPLLLRLCGAPSQMPDPVHSTKNKMYIVFYSVSPGNSTQLSKQGFSGVATASSCPTVTQAAPSPSSTQAPQPPATTPKDDYDLGPVKTPLTTISLPSVNDVNAISFGNQVVCGYPFFKPSERDYDVGKIIGGEVAETNSWPWQGSLRYEGRHICGVSIISQRHVITASHCFANSVDPQDYQVYFGKNTRDKWEPKTEQRLYAESVIKHPDYGKANKYDADIAIIRLKEPGAQFNSFVSPVCLPRRAPQPGMYCYVTGYGETNDTGGEGLLKQAKVPILTNENCSAMDPRIPELLNTNMFCAGYPQGGIDSCRGDSGGPLACKLGTFPHFWTLNGIVSFGFSCAQPNLPGIYTRVGKYIHFILENVNDLPPQQ